MITNEEIAQIFTDETGFFASDYGIAVEDFARAIYQLGRQHQRESDAALCFKFAEPEYLPSMHEYTEAGMCYSECEEAILANTGELK